MIRLTVYAFAGLLLAGCTDGAAPSASSSTAAVTGLTAGMSEDQVFEVMGPEAEHVRNPENWDQACVSYGTEGAYVHAVFEGGVLLRSSGGHAGVCSWGG